jgi:hypothetical protein
MINMVEMLSNHHIVYLGNPSYIQHMTRCKKCRVHAKSRHCLALWTMNDCKYVLHKDKSHQ